MNKVVAKEVITDDTTQMVTPLTVTQIATQKMVTKMVTHQTAKMRLLLPTPQPLLRKKKLLKIMVTPWKKLPKNVKPKKTPHHPRYYHRFSKCCKINLFHEN